jgi:hypothetical protein
MVGANANTGTRIYPDSNRAGPYVQQSVCAHCINSHQSARGGGYKQGRRGGESSRVPASVIEASANVGDVRVV